MKPHLQAFQLPKPVEYAGRQGFQVVSGKGPDDKKHNAEPTLGQS